MADIREAAAAGQTTNVTLTTTTEAVIISSPSIALPANMVRAIILAWAQLTTGTLTTTVTPRIRRGTLITDPLVGEANAENIKAAAGQTEPFMILLVEDITGFDRVEYSLTLQQAAATGNGTALQASILVLLQ